MSDLTITAASVKAVAGSINSTGTSGQTITAGQAVYRDATDNKIKLADANSSLAVAAAVGISLHGSAADQPIDWVQGGDIDLGATLVPGTIYVASGTAGGIAPSADIASGWWVTTLGVATSASNLKISVFASGGQL